MLSVPPPAHAPAMARKGETSAEAGLPARLSASSTDAAVAALVRVMGRPPCIRLQTNSACAGGFKGSSRTGSIHRVELRSRPSIKKMGGTMHATSTGKPRFPQLTMDQLTEAQKP